MTAKSAKPHVSPATTCGTRRASLHDARYSAPRLLGLAPKTSAWQVIVAPTGFPGGPGRVTTPEDFDSLMTDLEHRVFDAYADDTIVHPGHGKPTTLASSFLTCQSGGREGGDIRETSRKGCRSMEILVVVVSVALSGVVSYSVAVWQARRAATVRLEDLRFDLVRRLCRYKAASPELSASLNEVPLVFGDDQRAVELWRAALPSQDHINGPHLVALLVYLASKMGYPSSADDLSTGFN